VVSLVAQVAAVLWEPVPDNQHQEVLQRKVLQAEQQVMALQVVVVIAVAVLLTLVAVAAAQVLQVQTPHHLKVVLVEQVKILGLPGLAQHQQALVGITQVAVVAAQKALEHHLLVVQAVEVAVNSTTQ
jgi:hypothetical protein